MTLGNDWQYAVRLHYADAVQENLEKELTAMDLAGMIDIPDGVTKKLPYVKMRATGNYVKETDQSISAVKTGNDDITINTTPMVNFGIDKLDVEDNYINVSPEVIADATYAIKCRIDGDFFSKVLDAKWKYDSAGFGLNTGTLTPVALTTGASQNISTVFGNAKAGLVQRGANSSNLVLAADPFVTVSLTTLGLEAGFNIADESYTRGFKGMFGGMKYYEVANLTSSTVLDLATNPTAGDYIIVQGVKLTLVALGTAANQGEVSLGASADATAANIILAINGTGTPGASTYVEIDSDDRAILDGVTAVDGTDLITFTSKRGALMASSSMTNASNDFRAQTINCAVMEKGAIKMAIRNAVRVETREESKNLVTNYFIYARYGLKVPTRGAERICRIAIQSAAAEA